MEQLQPCEILRRLRRENGLTQHEAAVAIGVSDGAYAMYETANRVPRDDVKARISKLFGKPVGYIFFGEELTLGERDET